MAFTYQPQAAHVSSDEQLVCSACKVTVLPNERHSHYRSDWHRYNVKRKCVNMEPIDRSVFDAKLKSIIASGQQIESVSNKKKKKALNKTLQQNYDTLISNDQWQISAPNMDDMSSLLNYRCTLCNKTFKTHQQCLSHLTTKKHKIEFLKYHKDLRNQQQEEINVYQATNAEQAGAEQANNSNLNPSMDNLVPLEALQPVLTIENNPFITIRKAKIQTKHRGVHNYDEEAKQQQHNEGQTHSPNDNDKNNNNENNNDKLQEPRIAIDTHKQCLFCSKACESQEENIKHMSDEHGFFIPYPKRVTSFDSLLQTAGQIIGEYHQCVWCWKIFKSVRGVQTHMRHTGHCKLQIEYSSDITYCKDEAMNVNKAVVNEEEDSPFVQFIDFDKVVVDTDDEEQDVAELDQDGVSGRELMVTEKRHVTDINESAELVRSDGTVIGHRDNMVVYRQKHRHLAKYHETQSEEQIIAQINNPQRKLKLQEMERKKNEQEFEDSGARQQSKGSKAKEYEALNLQARQHKVSYQNWVNLQRSKQLF